MNKFDIHDRLLNRRTCELFDDFLSYASGATSLWTTTAGGSATATVGAGLGGLLTLSAVDSVDNREIYVATTASLFSFAANKPFMAEAYIQYAEANTNAANIAFGFMSSVGAASIQNDGAGPKSSYSGAVLYKVDGGTQWKTQSSVGTTQTTNQSDTTAGGSSYVRLRVEVVPISSTLAEVTYFVDGVQLKTASGRPGQTKIKDQLTYTGSTNMQLFLCLKNGTTTPESMIVDYVAAESLRALFTGF